MNFELTEDQRAYRDLAHGFAAGEIVPVAEHYDRTGDYPRPIVEKAFDAGLMYPNVPEKWGGAGLGLLDECVIAEELAWGCSGIALTLNISNVPALGLMLAGDEAQCARILAPAIADRRIMAYALTEPAAGSDVRAIQTRARRVGEEFSISGSKVFISSGNVASHILLFTVTDPEAGTRGLTAFCIPTDREGFRSGPPEKKMGQAASPLCALYLDEMRARADEVVGGVGGGFKLAMEIFNRSRQTIAAQAVGVARRAMEIAVDYANTRRTMGRPIIEHQAIGFLLAEMDVRIRAARLLTHEAAWLADVGRADRVAAARAKAFAADACMAVTTDAVQVLGGYGYMREYHVEKLMRDAKVMQIYEGTSQIQRLIIARSLSTASREEPGATIVDGARASAR